jgi:RNA polymerase sigma factor (sigma-70 family)
MTKHLFGRKNRPWSDEQVVEGLQRRDRKAEEWFYHAAKRYFDDHFGELFFDLDRRQEIFQTAFLKLWTEISNRRICLREERIWRQQRNGEFKPMTCTLTTFLMAFARNEYREVVRDTQHQVYEQLLDDDRQAGAETVIIEPGENKEELKNRIVDDCIGELSPRCAEILTLFYYQGMSLDDIMEARGDKNQSKNGLKTAKNKCMNTLRDRVITEFKRYHLTA